MENNLKNKETESFIGIFWSKLSTVNCSIIDLISIYMMMFILSLTLTKKRHGNLISENLLLVCYNHFLKTILWLNTSFVSFEFSNFKILDKIHQMYEMETLELNYYLWNFWNLKTNVPWEILKFRDCDICDKFLYH